jgi:ADP-ribose pyrophosphatase
MQDGAPRIVWQCPWWRVEEREFEGGDGVQRQWYTALRPIPDTVHVLGITPNAQVVMIHQWRVPIQARVWELPAGIMDKEGEPPEEAAARELEEETGWSPGYTTHLFKGPVSAGLCNEIYNGFLSLELRQTAAGGGVEGERIEPVLVEFGALESFIAEREQSGELVDCKILSHYRHAQLRLAEIGRKERASGNLRHSELISVIAAQPYEPSRALRMMLDSDA